jgi:hypothetical protein
VPPWKRKRVPADTLADEIYAILDGAGIPRAEWDRAGEVVANGYGLMLNGSGVEVRYVDKPHNREQHEVEITHLLSILRQHLDNAQRQIDGRMWSIQVRLMPERVYGWSEINVSMYPTLRL